MWSTLAQIQASTVKNIAGNCPTTDEFLALVNECCSRLLRRGDWAETVVPIQVCTTAGCVVFPRYVGHVRRINLCNSRFVPVNGLWWQFLDTRNRSCWGSWFGARCGAQQMGRSPVFQDILGDGRLLRVYVDTTADVGKTMKIFGVDNNNQPLVTVNSDGTWSDGIVLTFAMPFVSSSVFVRRIDKVVCDITNGPKRLYAYNQSANVLEDVATYEASETNPSFQKFQLNIPRCATSPTGSVGDCGKSLPILALVKLQYIPAIAGTDLILFPPDSIKEMYQSLRFAEAGDVGSAQAYEARAVRELNLELEELLSWDDATPITNEPFNNTGIGLQQMF